MCQRLKLQEDFSPKNGKRKLGKVQATKKYNSEKKLRNYYFRVLFFWLLSKAKEFFKPTKTNGLIALKIGNRAM